MRKSGKRFNTTTQSQKLQTQEVEINTEKEKSSIVAGSFTKKETRTVEVGVCEQERIVEAVKTDVRMEEKKETVDLSELAIGEDEGQQILTSSRVF